MGLALLAAIGCKPGESDARRIYATHSTTLALVDGEVRAGMDVAPPLVGPGPPCGPPPGAPPALGGDRERVVACLDAAERFEEARTAKRRALGQRIAGVFSTRPGVLGIAVRARDERGNWFTAAEVGLTPGGVFHGAVPWSDGVPIDGRRVGWGEYQTAYENKYGKFGDGTARVGIEVGWEHDAGGDRVRVEVYLLAEDEVEALDEAWRRGFLGG